MKINDNTNVGKLTRSAQQKSLEGVQPDKLPEVDGHAGDSSQVSALAKQIARAREIADALPDVRADKIALARKRLAGGHYNTPEAREVLVDKLASIIKDISS